MNRGAESGFSLPQPEFDSSISHEVIGLREALLALDIEEDFAREAIRLIDQTLQEPFPNPNDPQAVESFKQKMFAARDFTNSHLEEIMGLVARREEIESRLALLESLGAH